MKSRLKELQASETPTRSLSQFPGLPFLALPL